MPCKFYEADRKVFAVILLTISLYKFHKISKTKSDRKKGLSYVYSAGFFSLKEENKNIKLTEKAL